MRAKSLPLPSREVMVQHVNRSLSRYWQQNSRQITSMPVADVQTRSVTGPLRLQAIQLPEWAIEWSIEGSILVPSEACCFGDEWQQVDWWLAAFLLLECWHERVWELHHGPIHSYSFRLKGWDARVWKRAWCNRIGLFLRAWAAHAQNKTPEELFGSLPSPTILMTHDVDAIRKTLPIRLKQGAFNLFNAARYLLRGEAELAAKKFGSAIRFLFSKEDWWTFDKLLQTEKNAGIKAQFNFCADDRKKNVKSWLLDPDYDIAAQPILRLIGQIRDQQGIVGLHPTFDSWTSTDIIERQKERLTSAAGQAVTKCRQHWLRFGWADTWPAQEQAGVTTDMTLMFNDRPGFRAAAALAWSPWNQITQSAGSLVELPSVMMDSHFFDYQSMSETGYRTAMRDWLKEVQAVHGEIAVLWHPHTLTRDYGWTDGFQELIEAISEIQACPHLQ